ncbi:NADPH2:quinone reductase [Amycolatopsis arida]|uniref:NADPH2:quinone reductase n=1 Tax=Amycolatopsis arida TaxID=587909 RepID=A0A1I5SML6_9PSEU|nr:zinc-binding dehydrogenase [Amycolatopsis arida]TDX96420.1 NADPH2:quinone reductase [Amycolatopsis arida]SFP72034.1 NADPH2:quinone reductase [Amycolatopsis arida]
MHAIRQYAFGGPEELRYEEMPDPSPGAGQVRVAVAAAGVHLLDTTIRSGTSGGPFPLPELPMTPGREVAGVVDALGPGVPERWLGRRVVVHLGPGGSGGYAELAVADVAALHELPDHVPFTAAVAMVGTGRTAVGILRFAQLTAADVVLVPAAAGGIGGLLVQHARNVGATAIGLAGGEDKVALVRKLGVVGVDYTDPAWPGAVRAELGDREVTVVLDGVGGAVGRFALELLGVGGRILLFGWSAGEPTQVSTDILASRGLTASWAIGPRLLRQPGGLYPMAAEALAGLAAGEWEPLVNEPFPLAEAAAAHRALESRATAGKVVLVPTR